MQGVFVGGRGSNLSQGGASMVGLALRSKGLRFDPGAELFVIFFFFHFFSESINKTCDVHVDGTGQFHSPKEIMLSAVLTVT